MSTPPLDSKLKFQGGGRHFGPPSRRFRFASASVPRRPRPERLPGCANGEDADRSTPVIAQDAGVSGRRAPAPPKNVLSDLHLPADTHQRQVRRTLKGRTTIQVQAKHLGPTGLVQDIGQNACSDGSCPQITPRRVPRDPNAGNRASTEHARLLEGHFDAFDLRAAFAGRGRRQEQAADGQRHRFEQAEPSFFGDCGDLVDHGGVVNRPLEGVQIPGRTQIEPEPKVDVEGLRRRLLAVEDAEDAVDPKGVELYRI